MYAVIMGEYPIFCVYSIYENSALGKGKEQTFIHAAVRIIPEHVRVNPAKNMETEW